MEDTDSVASRALKGRSMEGRENQTVLLSSTLCGYFHVLVGCEGELSRTRWSYHPAGSALLGMQVLGKEEQEIKGENCGPWFGKVGKGLISNIGHSRSEQTSRFTYSKSSWEKICKAKCSLYNSEIPSPQVFPSFGVLLNHTMVAIALTPQENAASSFPPLPAVLCCAGIYQGMRADCHLSQHCFQWLHIVSLKLAMVGVFTS